MSEDKGARVLVTGASGFVALHIVQLLQREGYRVRGTVRSLDNENKLKSLKNPCPDAEHPVELVKADLTKDDGWDEAVKGCKYCIHVASPFPSTPPRRPEELIVPAVEGTVRVLKACANAGTIKRVVLTSSLHAIHGEYKNEKGRTYTEEDWTDLASNGTDVYAKSKTMAEKAAWDFVKSLPPKKKFELAVINPGLIFGPCIGGTVGTSLGIIQRIMNIFTLPMIPRAYAAICDVRDVALAHLRAMTLPEAVNNRHVIISGHMWFQDIARILKEEFGRYGYRISTFSAPNISMHLISYVDCSVRLLVPRLMQTYTFSNLRMKNALKIEPRDVRSVLLDTAYSLIECGVVEKTRHYKPRE